MRKTHHPPRYEIVKMTATELGRAVFDYRETLKALEREQMTRLIMKRS